MLVLYDRQCQSLLADIIDLYLCHANFVFTNHYYVKLVNTGNSHLELDWFGGKIKYENLIKHRQMIHLKRRNLENKTLINAIVLVKI